MAATPAPPDLSERILKPSPSHNSSWWRCPAPNHLFIFATLSLVQVKNAYLALVSGNAYQYTALSKENDFQPSLL